MEGCLASWLIGGAAGAGEEGGGGGGGEEAGWARRKNEEGVGEGVKVAGVHPPPPSSTCTLLHNSFGRSAWRVDQAVTVN